MSVNRIKYDFHELGDEYIGSEYVGTGWIMLKRKQNDITFLEVNDGSSFKNIQYTIPSSVCTHFVFKQGEYIKCRGIIQKIPNKYENEVVVNLIEEYSPHLDCRYPIIKRCPIDTLRMIPHLRGRTRLYNTVFRIRNTVLFNTHNFFQEKRFLLADPNMITVNECEGGAGVFTVSDIVKPNKTISDFKKDHFKKQTFLTVSSQLQLEALCCGLGNVYTTNRSFRSEHSSTSKHLSEFTHLEIEMSDCTNYDLMNIAQEYVRYMTMVVVDKHTEDLRFLDTINPGLIERIQGFLDSSFHRIPYDDLAPIFEKGNIAFTYGEDLSSAHEKYLAEHLGGPVFVFNWPKGIKSFYMREYRGNINLVENFDLIMPYGIGELIGGSMREDNYHKLVSMMKEKNVSEKGLEWYLDLRKYGSVPHGGFGLGLERLLMFCTGMTNIRDVIPFPNSYQSCKY
jgi:asparaginyl-tRNA synthetase